MQIFWLISELNRGNPKQQSNKVHSGESKIGSNNNVFLLHGVLFNFSNSSFKSDTPFFKKTGEESINEKKKTININIHFNLIKKQKIYTNH